MTNQFGNIFFVKQDLFKKEQIERKGIKLRVIEDKYNEAIYPFIISHNLLKHREVDTDDYDKQFISGKYMNSLSVNDLDRRSNTYKLLMSMIAPQSKIPQPEKRSYVNYNSLEQQIDNFFRSLSDLFNNKTADNVFLYLFKQRYHQDREYQYDTLRYYRILSDIQNNNVVDQQMEEIYGDDRYSYISYEEYMQDLQQGLLSQTTSIQGMPISDIINDIIAQFGQSFSSLLGTISQSLQFMQGMLSFADPILEQVENERQNILRKKSGDYVYETRYGVKVQPSVEQFKQLTEQEQMSVQQSVFVLKQLDKMVVDNSLNIWWRLFIDLISIVNVVSEQLSLGFNIFYVQDNIDRTLFKNDLGGSQKITNNEGYQTFEHTYAGNKKIIFDFISVDISVISEVLPISIQKNLYLIKPQYGFEKVLQLSNSDLVSIGNFENNFISGANKQFSVLHYNGRDKQLQTNLLYLINKVFNKQNSEASKKIVSSLLISVIKKSLKQIVLRMSKQDQANKIDLQLNDNNAYINKFEIKKISNSEYIISYNIFLDGKIIQGEITGQPNNRIDIKDNGKTIVTFTINQSFFDKIEINSIYNIKQEDVIDGEQKSVNDQQSQQLEEFINKVNIQMQTYPEQQSLQNLMVSQIFQQLTEHVVYFEDNIYDSLINLNNMLYSDGEKEQDLVKIVYQQQDMLYRILTEDLGFTAQIQDVITSNRNNSPILYSIFNDAISSSRYETIFDDKQKVTLSLSVANTAELEQLLERAENVLIDNLEKDYLYSIEFQFSSNKNVEVIDLTKTVQYQKDNGLSMILNLISSKYKSESLAQQLNSNETMSVKITKKQQSSIGIANMQPLIIYTQIYSLIIMIEEQLSYSSNLWDQILEVVFTQMNDTTFLFKYLWYGKITTDDEELQKMRDELSREEDTYERIKIIQSYMDNTIQRKKADNFEYTKDEGIQITNILQKFRLDNQVTFTIGYWTSIIFQYIDIIRDLTDLLNFSSFIDVAQSFGFDKISPFYMPQQLTLTHGYKASPILTDKEQAAPQHEDTTIKPVFDMWTEKGRLYVSTEQDQSVYDGVQIRVIGNDTVYETTVLHMDKIVIDVYRDIFYANDINYDYDMTYTLTIERFKNQDNMNRIDSGDRLILKIKLLEPIRHIDFPEDTDFLLIDRYFQDYQSITGYGYKYLGNMNNFNKFVYAIGEDLNNNIEEPQYGNFSEDWFEYGTITPYNNVFLDFNKIFGFDGKQGYILFGKNSIKIDDTWYLSTDMFTKAQKDLIYRIRPTEKIRIQLDSYEYDDTYLTLRYVIPKDFYDTSKYGNGDTQQLQQDIRNIIENISVSNINTSEYEMISINQDIDKIIVELKINKSIVANGQDRYINVTTPNVLFWRDSDIYHTNILKVPDDIHWSQENFGVLQWSYIQGQSRYNIILYRNGQEIQNFEARRNTLDVSNYITSAGYYYASIEQVSDNSVNSDIYTMDETIYLEVIMLSKPINAKPQTIEVVDPGTGESAMQDDISQISWDYPEDYLPTGYKVYSTRYTETYQPIFGSTRDITVTTKYINYEDILVLLNGSGIYSFEVQALGQSLNGNRYYLNSGRELVHSAVNSSSVFYYHHNITG